MKPTTRALLLLLALSLLLSACAAPAPESALDACAAYLLRAVPAPDVGSVGGEWAVLGLARSGCAVPDGYYDDYYARVETRVRACGGVLDAHKNTEYSRLILALTAIGKDPRDVAGYNLLLPLGDFEQTVSQGINGAIFALLALSSGDYVPAQNPDAGVQATRQLYLDEILSSQLPDGGWSLAGGEADVDLTAMALQALAQYRTQPDAADAAARGIEALAGLQNEDGSFSAWGEASCESAAQVIVALTALGIAPDDARFVKNGQTPEDQLLRFSCGDGSFRHTLSGTSDLMATEQALYALAALRRAQNGETTLYDMTDVTP